MWLMAAADLNRFTAVDGDGSNWSSGPGHWALRSTIGHAASLTVMGDRFKKLK